MNCSAKALNTSWSSERRSAVAHRIRLRERLERGHHVLIGYTASDRAEADQRAFANLLDTLRTRLGAVATGLAIAAPNAGAVDCEQIPILVDTADAFRHAYAAGAGMVWLIRPDGHIAWRSDRPDPERLDRFIARIVTSSACV